MAGNGDMQGLAAVSKALSGVGAILPTSGDLVARIDSVVNTYRELGQQARALEETSAAHANQVEKMLHEFHSNISEQLTDIARTIGRLGKRTPPGA